MESCICKREGGGRVYLEGGQDCKVYQMNV